MTEISFNWSIHHLIMTLTLPILLLLLPKPLIIRVIQAIQTTTNQITKVIKVQQRLLIPMLKLLLTLPIIQGKSPYHLIQLLL